MKDNFESIFSNLNNCPNFRCMFSATYHTRQTKWMGVCSLHIPVPQLFFLHDYICIIRLDVYGGKENKGSCQVATVQF